MSAAAVFLDRDGVLVQEVFYPQTGEREAPLWPQDVQLMAGAIEGARCLADAGYALVVISNQGGFAKGKTTLRALWLVHERFVALMEAEGVRLDACFYAFGHPDGVVPHFSGPSLDRKPGPYNLFIAAAQLDLDLSQSWMVGDRRSDVDCAHAAGVRPIRISALPSEPEYVESAVQANDLAEAAQYILQFGRPRPPS
jgi:D-glycero-D-manno-heptose 1,7-bisphosphate phosphatase